MSPIPGECLVTGATGFVGSAVARALLRAGHQVRVLARPRGDRRNLAGLPVRVAEGDLADAASLTRAVAGCRYLFHVAADYRLWVPDPEPMFRANVAGTRDLMQAALAAGVERVVHTSSVATLGFVPDGVADEETPSREEDMIGPYKRSKFQAEAVVRGLVAERGLPAVIVNPSTPVGPGDVKPTPTGRLILEAARGHVPGFVDTGLNIVHVDDVAAGHLAAAERGRVGERYILGGENMALAEILAEVARCVGRPPPRLKIPYAVALPVAFGAELAARATGREPFVTRDGVRMSRKTMYFASAKAARELDYRARPAREAIADAVAWFKASGYLK
ncbi:MAG TPA: hopanoid-associated sugar epimerase [Stellaceae bacterium]|nr:hopanoid-associated sugar epimerase [Stellaceae bacterium]